MDYVVLKRDHAFVFLDTLSYEFYQTINVGEEGFHVPTTHLDTFIVQYLYGTCLPTHHGGAARLATNDADTWQFFHDRDLPIEWVDDATTVVGLPIEVRIFQLANHVRERRMVDALVQEFGENMVLNTDLSMEPVGNQYQLIQPAQCMDQSMVQSMQPYQSMDQSLVQSIQPDQCMDQSLVQSMQPYQCMDQSLVQSMQPDQSMDQSMVQSMQPDQSMVQSIQPDQSRFQSIQPDQSMGQSIQPDQSMGQRMVQIIQPDQSMDKSMVQIIQPDQSMDERPNQSMQLALRQDENPLESPVWSNTFSTDQCPGASQQTEEGTKWTRCGKRLMRSQYCKVSGNDLVMSKWEVQQSFQQRR